MFLKSLEVRGFKSFADKTELRFDKGITAVVGPNGSGKSNVSDAVRWVLGEQSAKTLRGSKMEDIIFTGTEYRKAIGIASVSLTLDNTDESLPINFNEVKVTRRIYRSGESEYLINNSPCRLKDIVNLFMDTGIGKEGYSLIGQGKIDAILSGKSEDRRALLEEAAGIVKYKTRKNEAERKLKNTDENITRINDIVYTYEERLEPLKEEKKKAEKYIALATTLKEKDINLLVSNIVNSNEKLKEKQQFILSLEEKNNIEKEKNRNARLSLKNLREDLERLEEENANKSKVYLEKKESIVSAKSEIVLLKERIKNYNELIKKSNNELVQNEEKIKLISIEIQELKEQIEIKKAELTKSDELLKDYYSKKANIIKDIDSKNIEINNIKKKDMSLLQARSDYKSNKAILESKIESLSESLKSIKINLDKNESLIKINSLTKVNFDRDLSDIQTNLNNKISKRKNDIETLKTKKQKIEELNTELSKNSLELNKLEANREMLKKLEKSYEGYNVSVKKLMSHIDNNKVDIAKGVSTIVGEVITAKKGYETAIETSLGPAISNIITNDENIAKTMIEYLKTNKLGRATFLPLSIIKGKKIVIDEVYKKIDGYLGIASELIDFNSKFENIVNYLLGRTIICRDIDCALKFAKSTSYRYKIITLSGEVINAGGALTGGSIYQKNMGIISRKKEIDELEKKIEESKLILNDATENRNILANNIIIKETKISNLAEDIKKLELDVVNLKNKIKRLAEDIYNTKANSKNLVLENESINTKIESMLLEITVLDKNYSKLETATDNKQILDKLELEVASLVKKKEELDNSIMEVKIKLAELSEAVDSKTRVIKRDNESISEYKNRINILNSDNKKSEAKKIECDEKIISNNSFINYEEEKLNKFDSKAKEFEAYRGKMKEKLNKIESEVEILTLNIARSEEEIHKNKVMYARSEAEQNSSKSKLIEDYEIDVEMAIKKFVPIENIDAYRGEITSLKSRITQLGRVNVNAVEEYKDLCEKYDFLVAQRGDLESAKEELINIISDMTAKMRVIFRQNFNTLNNNFDATFKELFKGGSARLILDESDELSGDIEIRVQPPGKKIQNINLMSGGEKVLSAIALLFAILKMKPTPFCILDEIEAALDDANVRRYAEFLNEFSDDIQFIVITHRKGTMEVADIMYGVTMEEKGISKIVSVDLNRKTS